MAVLYRSVTRLFLCFFFSLLYPIVLGKLHFSFFFLTASIISFASAPFDVDATRPTFLRTCPAPSQIPTFNLLPGANERIFLRNHDQVIYFIYTKFYHSYMSSGLVLLVLLVLLLEQHKHDLVTKVGLLS